MRQLPSWTSSRSPGAPGTNSKAQGLLTGSYGAASASGVKRSSNLRRVVTVLDSGSMCW